MNVLDFSENIKFVGVDDREIDLFEGQYKVPDGISYNSFVIFDEKIAVTDSVDAHKVSEWLQNIENALQGKTPSAGTSAARYAQETQNATTSLESLMQDFTTFSEQIARKKCMMIKQFYRNGRMVFNSEHQLIDYDRLSVRDVDFEIAIKESAATAAYQTYVNDQAMQLLQLGIIDGETYLSICNLPFKDDALAAIEQRKAQQMAMQQQMEQQLAAAPANQQQVQNAQQMLQAA